MHGEPAAALFRERTDAGEHLLLMFMPPQESVRIATPRDVIFIVDTSGSMSGESMEQARAALIKGLRTLKPQDRFNVMQFNSTYDALFTQPVDANEENLESAHDYVIGLNSSGGTEMYAVLKAAQVLPLALQYGLVTQFTSLVAVDKTPARPDGERLDSHRIDNTKPKGSNWETTDLPKTATPATLQILVGASMLTFALLLGLTRRRALNARS